MGVFAKKCEISEKERERDVTPPRFHQKRFPTLAALSFSPPLTHSRPQTMEEPRSVKLARQRSCSSDTSFHTTRLRSSTGQLIVVANRLPVTITADSSAEGGYRFSVSSGGLASALSGCKKSMDFTVSSPRYSAVIEFFFQLIP